MAQKHSSLRDGTVALALVDNLIAVMRESGAISEAEKAKVIAGAFAGLRNSPNLDAPGAIELMTEMYGHP